MGFCYDFKGRLCCDFCNKSGGVRKVKCPYGYCQAWAICVDCKAKKLHLKSSCGDGTHKEICKLLSIECDNHEKERQKLLESGNYLRKAALSHGKRVKVIFRSKDDQKAFFMSHETYDSIPLGVNAIIEDYKKFGELTECKNCDIYDAEIEVIVT